MDSIGIFDDDGIWIAEDKQNFKIFLEKNAYKRTILKTKVWKKERSNNQNAYYWGVVIELICEHTGYFPFELHELMKFQFNRVVRKDNFGNEKSFPGSTTDLDTMSFEVYLDKIRKWAAIEYGIYIPLPNECIESFKYSVDI